MRLTRDNFTAWLRSKPPRARVGKPEHECECPIGTFLAEQGQPAMIVNENAVTFRERGVPDLPLPSWAAEFTHAVDALGTTAVTAARALRILESIPTRPEETP